MPARCPTCDRDFCNMWLWSRRADRKPAMPTQAHRDGCAASAVDWRARALAAEAERDEARGADILSRVALARASTDAARWRKVAPLIEALHQASMIEAGDPMHVVDAAMELLAATQEPTP